MFFIDTSIDSRLTQWREFRTQLEVSKDPLQEVQDLWRSAPIVNKYLETWNVQHWPTPWELLKENRFCPIAIPLMMGWTLKLTERFKKDDVLIKICIDHTTQMYYNITVISNTVLNYETNKAVSMEMLPDSLHVQYQRQL